ncbi:MAG TPA: recombination mediator RecR [Candidatus Saccharibacteria bacterium]|jgi:recombination protein RecR|nr:recombination mediator RecR [Candidatus Saccharibacteria bacterium]HMT55362.1 recombination mediator RecR [Candidatus Saccharibacteria bacterium]
MLPRALSELIEALGQLPGVGPRTAERYAYYILKSDPPKANKLAYALKSVHDGVKLCPITFALIDSRDEVSALYSDPMRDKTVVALVADAFDIIALEKTSLYRGTYHVLGGLISPIDGVGPEQLHILELKKRIKADAVKEVILATNASVEGEATAHYIQQELHSLNVIITKLARGIPIGVDLEYADQITLGRALEGRQSF